MLTQQIGMPVEELLKRKDELRREAPEFAAIIRILERLEGQTPSAPPVLRAVTFQSMVLGSSPGEYSRTSSKDIPRPLKTDW